MSFVHENAVALDQLLRIAGRARGLPFGTIEKDYWVTHTLWALLQQGFEVWFKGGTSLSKGFGIIERFSEDLDLKIEPGAVAGLQPITDWKRDSTRAKTERKTYFESLCGCIKIPGTKVVFDQEDPPPWRGVAIRVEYPVTHELPPTMLPYVRLEIGDARVRPFVECDLTSFVHGAMGDHAADFDDNRPKAVRCVHPFVTLLEKLDNLSKNAPKLGADAVKFVRHYEDVARIIARAHDLPPMPGYSIKSLAQEMSHEGQIRRTPAAKDPAFTMAALESPRAEAVRKAYADISHMFWNSSGRATLDDACAAIREWIAGNLG